MIGRPINEQVTAATLRPDGAAYAVGFADGTVEAGPLDPVPEARRLRGLSAHVTLLRFSPGGDALLGACAAGRALVWDVSSGEIIHDLGAAAVSDATLFDRDHGAIVAAGEVTLWEGAPGALPRARKLACTSVERCEAGEDRQLLLVDGFAWHTATAAGDGEPVARIVPEDFAPSELVRNVGLVKPAPGGGHILFYWDDVRIFDARTGRCEHRLQRPLAAGDAALDGSGEALAVGSIYGRLLVMGVRGDARFDHEVTPDEIISVSLSLGGQRVLYVDLNGGFSVFDVRSGRAQLSHRHILELTEPHREG